MISAYISAKEIDKNKNYLVIYLDSDPKLKPMNKSNQNNGKNSFLTISNLLLVVSVVLQSIIFRKLSLQEASIGDRLSTHLRESRQAITKLISNAESKFGLINAKTSISESEESKKSYSDSSKALLDEAYSRGKADGLAAATKKSEFQSPSNAITAGDAVAIKNKKKFGSDRYKLMNPVFCLLVILNCLHIHRETMGQIGGRTHTDKILHHGYERFYFFIHTLSNFYTLKKTSFHNTKFHL